MPFLTSIYGFFSQKLSKKNKKSEISKKKADFERKIAGISVLKLRKRRKLL